MGQIKYLVQAILLLLLLCLAVFVFEKFSSAATTSKQEAIVVDVTTPANQTNTANAPGKAIFSTNCATCHALDKVLTGPALRGVNERGPWVDRANLHKWVHSPGGFIPTTPYTQQLAASFGGQIMPSFPQLADKDVDSIFDYIKNAPSYSEGIPVAVN